MNTQNDEEKILEVAKHELIWMVTAPNPRVNAFNEDAGQRGWRLHLVDRSKLRQLTETSAIRATAFCGLYPRHGWAYDLFIDEPCKRCLRVADKLGFDVPEA